MKFFNAAREVYSVKGYYAFSLVVSLLVYSLNALIHNSTLVIRNWKVSSSLIFGFHNTVPTSSAVLLVIVSILSGIVMAFSVFLLRRQIKGSSLAGVSIVASVLAPACPACALGILGVVGIGGVISFLPFKGLELGLLGVLIVVISLQYLSKKICTNVCEIN